MLKNIPNNLSPKLLKIMMEMGHGDELVIGDGNFAAAGYGKRLVRADGLGTAELLESILAFFPLDTFVAKPVTLMEVVGDSDKEPEIWKDYRRIIEEQEQKSNVTEAIERFAFYKRAKKAYAIVSTTETSLYACMIIKKGVKEQ